MVSILIYLYNNLSNALNIGYTIAVKKASYDLVTLCFLSHIGDIGTPSDCSRSP